jgi:GAF domain-containing protein
VGSTLFEQSTARLASETTIRGLLGTTCRELVALLDASACMISRVIGDLLVALHEHTESGVPLQHGHEYLISDYPLTREVVESGEPQRVSRLEAAADPTEAELLEKLGFESLLMVCLPAHDDCWGLVEVYSKEGGFEEYDAELASRLATYAGDRIEALERRNAQ